MSFILAKKTMKFSGIKTEHTYLQRLFQQSATNFKEWEKKDLSYLQNTTKLQRLVAMCHQRKTKRKRTLSSSPFPGVLLCLRESTSRLKECEEDTATSRSSSTHSIKPHSLTSPRHIPFSYSVRLKENSEDQHYNLQLVVYPFTLNTN